LVAELRTYKLSLPVTTPVYNMEINDIFLMRALPNTSMERLVVASNDEE
jgi:hypothetical protein